ncbi:hypothetical protein F383_29046 [Gossypium arboreum]|uniref:Uncharacterized protein n=1 Tax=Gossypium arboreum TaxID=29729 RepID=A0A0B0MUU6_GOSAR|nr:hypothetical protein F383_29046 [Gossypium arboreum]
MKEILEKGCGNHLQAFSCQDLFLGGGIKTIERRCGFLMFPRLLRISSSLFYP